MHFRPYSGSFYIKYSCHEALAFSGYSDGSQNKRNCLVVMRGLFLLVYAAFRRKAIEALRVYSVGHDSMPDCSAHYRAGLRYRLYSDT